MRFKMDELVSLVNFGALTGFLLLHVSVLVHFWFRNRSGRWFVHLLVPLAGSVVVLAVLSAMSRLAVTLGIVWLAAGLIYGFALHERKRDTLEI